MQSGNTFDIPATFLRAGAARHLERYFCQWEQIQTLVTCLFNSNINQFDLTTHPRRFNEPVKLKNNALRIVGLYSSQRADEKYSTLFVSVAANKASRIRPNQRFMER
jgi:hypothetical protein